METNNNKTQFPSEFTKEDMTPDPEQYVPELYGAMTAEELAESINIIMQADMMLGIKTTPLHER